MAAVALLAIAQGGESPPLAEIRGRFVLPDGSPAAGVELAFRKATLVVRHLVTPFDFDDPAEQRLKTAGDGRFAIRFDTPVDVGFQLTASRPPYAVLQWRWHPPPRPGKPLELGDIRLSFAGSIAGRVRTPDGAFPGGEWTVFAETSSRTTRTTLASAADPVTGDFRIDGLPPGPVESLSAGHAMARVEHEHGLTITSGEITHADLVYSGPRNDRRIVVTQPRDLVDEASFRVRLRSATGRDREGTKLHGFVHGRLAWSFDDLEPGAYDVEVAHPAYEPWARAGVPPGSVLDPELTGNAALLLHVVDSQSRPIEEFSVFFRRPPSHRWDTLRAPTDSPSSFPRIPAGPLVLSVAAPGFAPSIAEDAAVRAGEERELAVRLERGAVLTGTVVRATTGAPIANAHVAVDRAREDPATPPSEPPVEVRAVTTAYGRFRVDGLSSGEWTVDATDPSGASCGAPEGVRLEAGAVRDVRVELEDVYFLDGIVKATPGASFEELSVCASVGVGARRFAFASIAADGRFRLGPLRPGTHHVLVARRITDHGPRATKLGDVEIVDRDVAKEFDASDRLPGRIHVFARRNGKPLAGHDVLVRRSFFESDSEALGADGSALVGPLPVGDWDLEVSHRFTWTYRLDRPIAVLPGRDVDVVIDVDLVEGSIRVVDFDTGAPVSDTGIQIRRRDGRHHERNVRTDADGYVRGLPLQRGSFNLEAFDGTYRRSGPSAFEWTSDASTAPVVVRLLAKDR